MLDLKKLEEKLDNALTNETSESLTSWLQEKRLRSYLQTLGEGTFVKIKFKIPNKKSKFFFFFYFNIYKYIKTNKMKINKKVTGINELGVNTPGYASLEQLERWEAEIQASDDEMTQIKLAIKCAEGVMWIWREKHPNDNHPQAVLDAVKAYINDPSEENVQNCRDIADDAWAAWEAGYDDDNTDVAVYYAVANTAYTIADYPADSYTNAAFAAAHAINALTNYQEKRQLNELQRY